MMNPNVSLVKLDDIKDSKGQTFHIGELPEIEDTQNYDLNNPNTSNLSPSNPNPDTYKHNRQKHTPTIHSGDKQHSVQHL